MVCEECPSGFEALAVICNPKTYNVGSRLTIQAVIKNTGSVSLPVGTYLLAQVVGAPTGPLEASYEFTAALPPTGTFTWSVYVDPIPPEWSDAKLTAYMYVYDSKAKGKTLANEYCFELVNISAAVPSAGILSISAV